jgi:hypothetical protein
MRNTPILSIIILIILASACGNTKVAAPTKVLPYPSVYTVVPGITPIIFSTSRPLITLQPTTTPLPSLTPFAIAPAKSRVEFKASDGQPLVGYFYPSWKANAPVVVLMHQRFADQTMWDESIILWLRNWPIAAPAAATPTLSANGMLPLMPANLSFAVFTFDFRDHGESVPLIVKGIPEGQENSLYPFVLDAKAAYQIAGQMPGVNSNQIIGIGASIGADAVVDACAEGCLGAFSVSPGNWLGIDYGNTVAHLIAQGKSVRCMYGTTDEPSPATCSSLVSGKKYKSFAYIGKKHGMTFFVPRKMEADFGVNMLEFLKEALYEK